MSPRPLALAIVAMTSCALFAPTNWRSYDADQREVETAIQLALAEMTLRVDEWVPTEKRASTEWLFISDGTTKSRERFVISWERETSDGTYVVYVRHERQDQDDAIDGVNGFGPMYHSPSREAGVLDHISQRMAGYSKK